MLDGRNLFTNILQEKKSNVKSIHSVTVICKAKKWHMHCKWLTRNTLRAGWLVHRFEISICQYAKLPRNLPVQTFLRILKHSHTHTGEPVSPVEAISKAALSFLPLLSHVYRFHLFLSLWLSEFYLTTSSIQSTGGRYFVQNGKVVIFSYDNTTTVHCPLNNNSSTVQYLWILY